MQHALAYIVQPQSACCVALEAIGGHLLLSILIEDVYCLLSVAQGSFRPRLCASVQCS